MNLILICNIILIRVNVDKLVMIVCCKAVEATYLGKNAVAFNAEVNGACCLAAAASAVVNGSILNEKE